MEGASVRDRWITDTAGRKAYVGVDYKQVYLGTYDTPEEAADVAAKASERLYER